MRSLRVPAKPVLRESGSPKGSLAKGSWYHRHLRDSQWGLSQKNKPMWKSGSLLSPRFGFAKPPPFDKGGFVAAPQRLPCQRELAPEATEGFTAGTFQKYKPMWKPASLLSPRFCFAKPPPFGKGGFVLSTYCTAVTIPDAKRLPCQRELAPEATEGFTAGTFQKYKPMWKLASLRNPPGLASPNHPPLTRGALSYAPTAPQ